MWPNLMPGQIPNQFWYFYPTGPVWQAEFETKWVPDFLPRDQYKKSGPHGWRPQYDSKKEIKKIEFNSGINIYAKAYSQKIKDLQSGSVYAMFLDEEPPADFMPELQARLRATHGYMSAVFTATLGQEYWRRVMEPKTVDEEIYKNALKLTVSLYDSQYYVDGTPSRWTTERIDQVINECPTDADIQRRVFGRFVKSSGLKFQSFDIHRNTIEAFPIPKLWAIFSAVDPGTGGAEGHPAAMLFCAVRPDYKFGIIFRARRMDGIATASPDILKEYRNQKGPLLVQRQIYDYKDKDFFLVAEQQGESFEKADKSRDAGVGLLNSLFKNGMLTIQRGDPELNKLIVELSSLAENEDKRKAKDDLADCARYMAMAVPWDFSDLKNQEDPSKYDDKPPDKRSAEQISIDEIRQSRRDFTLNKDTESADDFEYWNGLAGTGNDDF